MELAPIVCALICAFIASGKDRSVVGWFFIGLFLNVLGLILAVVVEDLRDGSKAQSEQRSRARQMEEQLRQERQRRQELEREVAVARERIDLHDQALGIETRPLDPPPPVDPRYLGQVGGSLG